MKVKPGDILSHNPPDDDKYLVVSLSKNKLAAVYLHHSSGFPPLYVDTGWCLENADAIKYTIIGNIFDKE